MRRDGTRAVALLLEDARRHAHRQPRRGHLEQLPLLRDAGQLPGVARCAHRQGAVARRDRRLQRSSTSRHRRPSSSATTCWSAPATTSTRRASCSPSTRETGKRKWIFYTVPMKPGDPGLDTWPNLDAARHGGGQIWIPGAYDPETDLYIFGTGNPDARLHRRGAPGRQPVHLHADRGQRRHRQDGLVLPDLAARHARLGFGADAGPVRRA